MKFRNMTGDMLGNERCEHRSGAPWANDNYYPVWICPTLRKALEILEASQNAHLDGNIVWTTIYRVVARDIECELMKNGLWLTHTPTKIYVDEPVMYKNPNFFMTEEQLLSNANDIRMRFSKITRKAFKEKMKRRVK